MAVSRRELTCLLWAVAAEMHWEKTENDAQLNRKDKLQGRKGETGASPVKA